MTWLASIKARLAGWAVAIAAAFAIVAGAYLKGRADKSSADAETRLDEVRKARKIEDETGKLGGAATGERLRKWMRD